MIKLLDELEHVTVAVADLDRYSSLPHRGQHNIKWYYLRDAGFKSQTLEPGIGEYHAIEVGFVKFLQSRRHISPYLGYFEIRPVVKQLTSAPQAPRCDLRVTRQIID